MRKDDKLAISHNNMGVLLAKMAKYDQVRLPPILEQLSNHTMLTLMPVLRFVKCKSGVLRLNEYWLPLQAQEHYKRALKIDPGYTEARTNLAAVHRVRSSFVELVKLHQEASLAMEELSAGGQAGLVVAGYKTAGDGLGSHTTHLIPIFKNLMGSDVVMLDTADSDSKIQVDGKRVLVVVEVCDDELVPPRCPADKCLTY